MPVNNVLGSNSSTAVDLYKLNQSTGANSQRKEPTQQVSKKEVVSVQISQEALDLQKKQESRQVEFEQKLQADQEIKEQTDTKIQDQRVESKEYTEQQSIDVVV